MHKPETSRFIQSIVTSLFAVLGVLFCGCNESGMNSLVKQYRGQGTIRVLKAPLGGSSGYLIEMPTFDLSKPLAVEYRLDGIPKGKHDYTLYLVVPEPCPFDLVRCGSCSFQVKKNGATLQSLSSRLMEMTVQKDFDKNKFYFFGQDGKNTLSVDDATSKWSIVVACSNSVLIQNVKAHIEISEGGEK
jgi:hypothetical protein